MQNKFEEIPFIADGDDLAIRKFVALLETGALSSSLDLLLKVKGNVTQLLLHITNDFSFGCRAEAVPSLGKDLHEVVGKITPGKIDTENGMWQSITCGQQGSMRKFVPS